MSAKDAIVIGSGPNGLGAAITLAGAGRSVTVFEAQDTVGGGARSEKLTLPGFVHDVCSAVHPLAVSSPLFRSLPLERHGLAWVHPQLPLAHPLDGGTAAILHRSLDATAAALGPDEAAFLRLGELVYPVTLNRETDPEIMDRSFRARVLKLQHTDLETMVTPRPPLDQVRFDHWWTFRVMSRK